jgi:parallel beta-helix repeat protein
MKKVTCFTLVLAIVLTSVSLLSGKIARAAATVYPVIEAENYNAVSGTLSKTSNYGSNNNTHLININSGNTLTFNTVDFMSGAATIQARIATPRAGGTLEVRLGSATGALVTTISIPNTHAWTKNMGIDWSNGWRVISASIPSSPTGVQKLVLVFKNSAGGRVADFDWFRLLSVPTPTTYYVSTSGSDNNSGTSTSNPFKTINIALSKVLPGDTVEVAGGTYNEQVFLKSIYSGTAQNRITLRSRAGQMAVINGASIGANPVVNARADYVTIYGLEIINSSNMGISGDGDFMLLKNLKVHANQGSGISIMDSDSTQILNNEVYDNVRNNMPLGTNTSGGWGASIISYHAYNIVIKGNYSHDNGGEGIIAAPDSFNFIIANNVVRDNWSVGIYLDGAHNTVVEQNLVYDTETSYIPQSSTVSRNLMTAYGTTDEDYSSWSPAGVWGCGAPGWTPSQNNTFRNNIAINTRFGFAFTWQYLSCSGLINDVIENNTFVNTWQEAIKLAPGTHSGSVFRNNIATSKGSSDSSRVVIAQTRNNTQFDNNLFWTVDNNATAKFLWRTDQSYSPSMGFNAFNSTDHVSGNFWGNPKLVALGSLNGDIAANHKLTVNSLLAIDKGAAIGAPNVDYWAAARPTGLTVDIGAAEFGGSVVPITTSVPATPTFIPPTATNVANPLRVQYLPGNIIATINQIQPRFKITNNAASSTALTPLTVRYYFTSDGTSPLIFTCQSAALGCGNITGRFVQMSTPVANANTYLEINFTGGTIPAHDDSGEIWVRITKTDNSTFRQGNDYSFGATITAYTNWARMPLYQNGVMVWGSVPEATIAAPSDSGSVQATPTFVPQS